MPIVVNLDVMLAKRKTKSKELADHVGITEANLSLLKSGKVKGVRFATLEAICGYLDCQPGDLLEYVAAERRQSSRDPARLRAVRARRRA
jgi:putative transcriptional regulator